MKRNIDYTVKRITRRNMAAYCMAEDLYMQFQANNLHSYYNLFINGDEEPTAIALLNSGNWYIVDGSQEIIGGNLDTVVTRYHNGEHAIGSVEELKHKLAIDTIARDFSKRLEIAIGKKNLAKVNIKNIVDGDCCATHDYCDANQFMIDTLESFGYIIMITVGSEVSEKIRTESDKRAHEETDFVNQVWDYAKRNQFFQL